MFFFWYRRKLLQERLNKINSFCKHRQAECNVVQNKYRDACLAHAELESLFRHADTKNAINYLRNNRYKESDKSKKFDFGYSRKVFKYPRKELAKNLDRLDKKISEIEEAIVQYQNEISSESGIKKFKKPSRIKRWWQNSPISSLLFVVTLPRLFFLNARDKQACKEFIEQAKKGIDDLDCNVPVQQNGNINQEKCQTPIAEKQGSYKAITQKIECNDANDDSGETLKETDQVANIKSLSSENENSTGDVVQEEDYKYLLHNKGKTEIGSSPTFFSGDNSSFAQQDPTKDVPPLHDPTWLLLAT